MSGINRHIAVDTQGLLQAIAVTAANVTDRKGALEAMKKHKTSLSKTTHVLADAGLNSPERTSDKDK